MLHSKIIADHHKIPDAKMTTLDVTTEQVFEITFCSNAGMIPVEKFKSISHKGNKASAYRCLIYKKNRHISDGRNGSVHVQRYTEWYAIVEK